MAQKGHRVGAMVTAGQAQAPRVSTKAQFTLEGTAGEGWRHRAACRPGELPPTEPADLAEEIFFPVGSTGPSVAWIEDAKAICRRCPDDVVASCLAFALEHGHEAGVWGGLSEDERRALKRKAARARGKADES